MPRQRIHQTRETYGFPYDFPERLKRFQEESKLPWAEINRRLDTYPETVRRWRDKGVGPARGTCWRCWSWLRTRAWATCSPSDTKKGLQMTIGTYVDRGMLTWHSKGRHSR